MDQLMGASLFPHTNYRYNTIDMHATHKKTVNVTVTHTLYHVHHANWGEGGGGG